MTATDLTGAADRYLPEYPWSHFQARSPRAATGVLDIDAWTHHGTAWITLTGALTSHTADTLRRFFGRIRPSSPQGTVLHIGGLSRLDSTGVRIVTAERHLLSRMGREFTVVAEGDHDHDHDLPGLPSGAPTAVVPSTATPSSEPS